MVYHKSEIGYHVLYLLTLIEAHASIYLIRYIILEHLLLESTALIVCSVKYGEVRVMLSFAFHGAFDVLTDANSFFFIA